MKIFVILVIARLAFATEEDQRPCSIETPYGIYRGCEKETLNGRKVCCYDCIRYAWASDSFGAPTAATPTTTSDETINPPSCPKCYQNHDKLSLDQMSHDCMFIHVHVPQSASRPLPVLCYIHGGGFAGGWGPGPDEAHVNQLLRENIAIVSFNYRLGPWGFMCTGTCNCQGNAGVKDVVLALEWVQKNIKTFGGDEKNVTIMGFSAGSALCSLLLHLDMPRPLFKRAILESGDGLCGWSYTTPAEAVRTAHSLGEKLGCDPTLDSFSMCECIKKTDPDIILSNLDKILTANHLLNFQLMMWPPTAENKECSNCILNEPLTSLMTKPPVWGPYEICMGVTSAEFAAFKSVFDLIGPFIPLLRQIIWKSNNCFNELTNTYCINDIISELVSFYCKDSPSFDINSLIQVCSFAQFVLPSLVHAKLLSENNCTVYLYQYTYTGPCSAAAQVNSNQSTHGEMYPCVYPSEESVACNAIYKDEKTEYITENFLKMYTNFIQNGCPTTTEIEWEPFTSDHPAYLQIDEAFEMRTCMQNEETALWSSLLSKTISDERCSLCPIEHVPTTSCNK